MSHRFSVPVVKEVVAAPSAPALAPTQRELVLASLLVRPRGARD